MRRALLALAVLIGLVAAAPAHASKGQVRVFQDDRLTLYSGPLVRAAVLDNAKQMGVDVVRVQFVWRNIALSKPRDAADPNSYGNAWSNWDSLVLEAKKRGLRVLATVTGPAPGWAAGTTDKYFKGSRYPSAKAFGEFMTAVGRRYNGTAKTAATTHASIAFARPAVASAGILDALLPGGTGAVDPAPCTPVPPVIACGPTGPTGPTLPPPPSDPGGGGGGGDQPPPSSGGGDQSAPPPPGSGEPTPPQPPNTPLPKISLWSIYNEPNHPLFLSPQRRNGVLVAPSLYRELYRAAYAALQRTGHRRDTILIGETLPIGSNGRRETSTTSPLTFARELFCMNGTGRRHPGCNGRFRKLHASGWALHPYYRRTGPFSTPPGADDITPVSMVKLHRLLVRAGRKGRVSRGLSIWDTENGAQTRPPDPKGAPLSKQARFINEAEFLAWRTPFVRSFSQYLLMDEDPVWAFQSGLRFKDGRPKPALLAYQLPIHVSRAKGAVTVWGRVPPDGDGVVTIDPSSGRDVTFTARRGAYFAKRVPNARSYQIRYGALRSRTAR